jgi:hypothetical protein
MIFDRTCKLGTVWAAGARLYRGLGRLDAARGVASWSEAFEWLRATSVSHARPIGEAQFWGHGHWGCALIGSERLDVASLALGHSHHAPLQAVRERLVPGGGALWWFRTCETFGTQAGHDFARAWTRFFDCRAAGHTYVIGVLQSGLHVLAPGAEPDWSVEEGVATGSTKARGSSLRAPNTISFLHGSVR